MKKVFVLLALFSFSAFANSMEFKGKVVSIQSGISTGSFELSPEQVAVWVKKENGEHKELIINLKQNPAAGELILNSGKRTLNFSLNNSAWETPHITVLKSITLYNDN